MQEWWQWAKKAFGWFAKAGVQPPYGVMLSLVNIYGLYLVNELPTDQVVVTPGECPIDVSEVLVPMQLVDDAPSDVSAALRSTLAVVWQAASWPRSPLFNNRQATYRAAVTATNW